MATITTAISAEGRVRSMVKCKNCTNLYNLSDENDVIVGKWCPKISDSPDVEAERECGHYKRMTRADRIHSMSYEELAELFYSLINLEDKIKFCKNKTECEDILDAGKTIPDNMCKQCLVEWLQSEVEV